ncbi:hypothetical protein [Desulfamplus magnetovallimortis]|nr:hypothetical protein [Desulfamplus magnetovallimortis]
MRTFFSYGPVDCRHHCEDEDVLLKLSGEDQIDDILLNVVAIGWINQA